MIKFFNITKSLHGKQIVRDFSYEVEKGKLCFITGLYSDILLKMAYGLDNRYEGDIYMVDPTVDKLNNILRGKDIGYVSFEMPYLEDRSIYYNLYLAYILHYKRKKEFSRRLYKFTSDTPLFNNLKARVSELNYLEKSYFKFLRGIINYPKVVLIENFYLRDLDEYIKNNIRVLQSMGITVLYSLNNPHLIEYFSEFDYEHIELN